MSKNKNKILPILAVGLLGAPIMGSAELVQAGAGNILTFRQCIAGETVCDDFGPMQQSTLGGLPDELAANASLADPAYGEANGSAQLTGAPGAAEMHASVTSMPATRNGSTNVVIQRYTNTSASAESLTFDAILAYERTVPDENAGFPTDDSRVISGAHVEIVIFSMSTDALEVGMTAESNIVALMFEEEPAGLKDLDYATTEPSSNVTGDGTESISSTATVEPGDSVWLFAILQDFAVNGAAATSSLSTSLESTTTE